MTAISRETGNGTDECLIFITPAHTERIVPGEAGGFFGRDLFHDLDSLIFFSNVAFQISLGIVAVASRNDSRDLDCGVFVFPETPLAARSEGESRFPKVFEEIADSPWHRETIPILGRVAISIYAPAYRDGVSANVPECFEGGENTGDLIGALFVFATEAGDEVIMNLLEHGDLPPSIGFTYCQRSRFVFVRQAVSLTAATNLESLWPV